MSTDNHSSRRQKKVPSWFLDHVIGNSSQKKNDNMEQGTTEEIRVEKGGLNEEFRENDVESDKGVFGNVDNSQNQGGNPDAHKDGLRTVIDKGPWMVNNRPLIVQQWNHEIGIQKAEHSKLPLWVRMTDVPLKAWSIDGISALASSLGNPLIMDNMIASMCHNGIGMMDFARVLVEMDVGKDFKKEIKVQYKDGENKIKGIKKVNVTYDWKPAVCTHCKVFGHDYNGCKKRTKTQEEIDIEKKRMEDLERGEKWLIIMLQ
ncbi:RNA-directed DNA polymerase, eukaryota, reverse transcriptase zinc-binding domain protein [Tanacetum coccineum]|uniref:RNA-directed DNA polymerase, eukaryota, reverse transcriptase zinc-binding domain protein n=1 Tax=Tanacetum coccineum TaxID=301880 RepID=A0ABQ5F683_9ASTR